MIIIFSSPKYWLLMWHVQTLIRPGLRVVSLNTALYIVKNEMNLNVTDPANQVIWDIIYLILCNDNRGT